MTTPSGPDLEQRKTGSSAEDLSTVANGDNKEPPATPAKASEAPADAKVTKPKDSEVAAAPTPARATEHPPVTTAAASKQDDQPKEKQPGEPPSTTPVTAPQEEGKQQGEPAPSPTVKADVPVTSSRVRTAATSTLASKAANTAKTRPSAAPVDSSPPAAEFSNSDAASTPPSRNKHPTVITTAQASGQTGQLKETPSPLATAADIPVSSSFVPEPTTSTLNENARPSPSLSKTIGTSKARLTAAVPATPSASVGTESEAHIPSISPESESTKLPLKESSSISVSTSLRLSTSVPSSEPSERPPADSPAPTSTSSNDPLITSVQESTKTRFSSPTPVSSIPPGIESSEPSAHSIFITSSDLSAASSTFAPTSTNADVPSVSSVQDVTIPPLSTPPTTSVGSVISSESATSLPLFTSASSQASATPSDIFAGVHSSVLLSATSDQFSFPRPSQSATISSTGRQPALTSDVSTFSDTKSSFSSSLGIQTTTIPSPASTGPQVSPTVAPSLDTLSSGGSASPSVPTSAPTTIRHRRPLATLTSLVPATEVSSAQNAGSTTSSSSITTPSAEAPESRPGTRNSNQGARPTPRPKPTFDPAKHDGDGIGSNQGASQTRSLQPDPTNVSKDDKKNKAPKTTTRPSQSQSNASNHQGGRHTATPQSTLTSSQKDDKDDSSSDNKTSKDNHGDERTQPTLKDSEKDGKDDKSSDGHKGGQTQPSQPQPTSSSHQKEGKDDQSSNTTAKDNHAGNTQTPQSQSQSNHEGSQKDDEGNGDKTSGRDKDGQAQTPSTHNDPQKDGEGDPSSGRKPTEDHHGAGQTQPAHPQSTHDGSQEDGQPKDDSDGKASDGGQTQPPKQPTHDGSHEDGKGGKDDHPPPAKTTEDSHDPGPPQAPQSKPTHDSQKGGTPPDSKTITQAPPQSTSASEQKNSNSGEASDSGQTRPPKPNHSGSQEGGEGGEDGSSAATKTTEDNPGAGHTQTSKGDNSPSSKTSNHDAGHTQALPSPSANDGEQKDGEGRNNGKGSDKPATPQGSETTKDNQGTKPTSPPNLSPSPQKEGKPDNTKELSSFALPEITTTKDVQESNPTFSPVTLPGSQKGDKPDNRGPKGSSNPDQPNATGLDNQGAEPTPSLSSSIPDHSVVPTRVSGSQGQGVRVGVLTNEVADQVSGSLSYIVTLSEVSTVIQPTTTILQTYTTISDGQTRVIATTVFVTSAPLTTSTFIPTTISTWILPTTTTTIPSGSGSSTNTGPIVGGVVGGILILIAAFIMFLCMRRRRRIQLHSDAVANQMTGAFSSQMPTVVISSQRSVSATSPHQGSDHITHFPELVPTDAASTTTPSPNPSELISIRSPTSPSSIPAQRRKPVPGYTDTDFIDLASDSTARTSSTTTSSSTLSMEFWTPLTNPYGNTERVAEDPFKDPDPPNANKHIALAALALSDDPFMDPGFFSAPGQKRLSGQSTSSSQRSVTPQFGFAV